jgi:hypothetical protein
MRAELLSLAFAGCVLLAPATAGADGFITPYVGFNFGGDSGNCVSFTQCEERRLNWGVRFGGTGGALGFEADIGYAPDFFGKTPGTNNAVLTVMSNLLIIVPAGPFRPYGLVGVGLIRPRVEFSIEGLAADKNAFGYDFGGGLNLFLARHVGLHGDIRRIKTFEDITLGIFSGEKLGFWRASAGLTFRF